MSASPVAAIGFIILLIVFWNPNNPAALVTTLFLIYAPAYLFVSYMWDKIRFAKKDRNMYTERVKD